MTCPWPFSLRAAGPTNYLTTAFSYIYGLVKIYSK